MTSTHIALLAAAGGIGVLLYFNGKGPPPPPAVAAFKPVPPPPFNPHPTLDAVLTGLEKQSISTALSIEKNPANLRSFAEALEGNAPVAASLLKAKAAMLDGPVLAPNAPNVPSSLRSATSSFARVAPSVPSLLTTRAIMARSR